MAESSSPSTDPPPAPGVPEIRIRKGSDIGNADENHVSDGGVAAASTVFGETPEEVDDGGGSIKLKEQEEDAISKDDVFDPYSQGYGQLADGDSPYGIKLHHAGAHEAGVSEQEDDDRLTAVTDPDAPSPTPEDVVSMDIDQEEDDDDEEEQEDEEDKAGGGQGYEQMTSEEPAPDPVAEAAGPTSGWEGLGAETTTNGSTADTNATAVLDFDMFESGKKLTESTESDSIKHTPPPRPKSPSNRPLSPVAPRRPLSPAGSGRRSVSPSRPEPPRSRSPARPKSPISRSKSPARPPPPKSPQTVGADGGGGAKKPAPARPPSRPPPPGSRKGPAPPPAEFDQEESELVEINAQSTELSKSGGTSDLLSPELTGGDVAADRSSGGLTSTTSTTTARDRPRSTTPINKAALQDYAESAESGTAQEKVEDERIKITLPKHQLKARSKSPRKSPASTTTTVPMAPPAAVDSSVPAAPGGDTAGSWMTFEDDSPLPKQSSPEDEEEEEEEEEDEEEEEEEEEEEGEQEEKEEQETAEPAPKKKPPPRPAPPSNVPNRPPPPSAASLQRAAQKKPDVAPTATRAQPAAKAPKQKKGKFKSAKKMIGLGKGKKKKGGDDLEDILNAAPGDRPAPSEKSAEFAAFEAMQARIAGTVTATQGRLDNLGREVDKTIAHIEATNSPWTVMVGSAPGEAPSTAGASLLTSPLEDEIADPKAGWEGFDDSFSSISGESAKKLAGLAVTPIPSPHKQPPVPPNNSRRNSNDGAQQAGTATEVDLLGLNTSAETGAPADKADGVDADLLGLMGGDPSGGSLMSDVLALSRNPVESAKSSGMSTPNNATDIDPFKLDADSKETDGVIHDPYIDDFLGLSGDKASAGGAVSSEVTAAAADDDIFGLGTTKKADETDTAKQEDLDPFMLPPEVNAITAGENITEAPEPEKETTGDDFLNMAAQVVKETEKEMAAGRDPDDFGGFGTPVAAAERKVETITTESKKSGKSVVIKAVARPRPKKQVELATFLPPPPQKEEIKEQNDLLMVSPGSDDFDPRGDFDAEVRPMPDNADSIWATGAMPKGENPFKAEVDAKLEAHKAANNPFMTSDDATGPSAAEDKAAEGEEGQKEEGDDESKKDAAPHDDFDIFGPVGSYSTTATSGFNPFATIVPDDDTQAANAFDPFATIQGDDAFVDIKKTEEGETTTGEEDKDVTSPRVNPFDKEPPLDEKFASFEPKTKGEDTATEPTFEAFTDQSAQQEMPEEQLPPLPPYREPFTGDGWHLLLRQPAKKKLTGNRYWKAVYVRLVMHRDIPTVRVFNNERDAEIFHELPLQPCYQMCDMGLQQYDQYGKCHTVKIQYVFYRERVGVKADRITPTLGDIARVRDLKGLKDLVHKPKATMILDHAPQASELLKFGSLDYDVFRTFVWTLEDAFFNLVSIREVKAQNYTKDEITIDIVDEYYLEIDTLCHITFHKARVRVFGLAFLTGSPTVELGINDKRRKGKEIVGRKDIIPIRTDEWIHIEDPVFHCSVDRTEYERSKVIKFIPLDACHYEIMRFRTRPKKNRELPLQIRVQQSVVGNHIEIRADVIIPGYYSNSRRAAQTPCEDISIVFAIPETWIYMFRVEKRFKYGSVKAATRKPGKIKGLERLTQMAQGILPPGLIEVSTGSAKYENVFHGIVWRIARLPERNEGAYKQHFFKLRVDLGPHDVMPETFEKYVAVQFQMPNSMVSRAQVRSIGVSDVEDPPDRWVHHLAKYEYLVEIERVDQTRTSAPEPLSSIEDPTTPDSDEEDEDDEDENDDMPGAPRPAGAAEDSDSSSSDDD